MMRFKHRSRIPVICLTLWVAGAGALAEQGPVLKLEELDDDGKTTTLGEKPLAIVDINSEIKVQLDSTVLEARVTRLLGDKAVSDELIKKVSALKNVSQKGLELIGPLTQALKQYAENSEAPDAVKALSRGIAPSANAILEVIAVAENDRILYTRLNAALEAIPRGAPRTMQNRALFEAAAAYADELKQTIDELLRKEGAYVQLGAWIIQDGQDRPLHLRGFDEYPEGDFFVVDRWTIVPLSESQKKQLKDAMDIARTVNEKGIGELFKTARVAPGAVADILAHAAECAQGIEAKLASVQTAAGATVESIRNSLNTAGKEQQEYKNYVLSLRDKYDSVSTTGFSSGAALLESTYSDLVEFQQKTKSFVESQLRLLNDLQGKVEASASQLQTAIQEAVKVVQACREKSLEGPAADSIAGLTDTLKTIRLSQEINTAVLEFGEEVLKHTLDKIPQSTELNLKRAGLRKAGDAVVLKLAAGSAQRQRQVLEERRLDLYRVLPHIEMAIGIIFADPTESTEVESRFQVAPSYSILLKGFGDRGVTYNRLLTPGFGVNVSALDFNKDDTPELGIAVVGSLFRDYFQVGYGYNINEDADYWFFGLRLPLGTFTLPRPENDPQP